MELKFFAWHLFIDWNEALSSPQYSQNDSGANKSKEGETICDSYPDFANDLALCNMANVMFSRVCNCGPII